MCLAVPARVIAVEEGGANARVELGGLERSVSLALVEGVKVGDYLLIHVGFAINTIDPEEARRTLALFAEAGMLEP